MRVPELLALSFFLSAALLSPSGTVANNIVGDTGDAIAIDQMPMTFDEEFNKLDISEWGPGTRWISHTPWSGDFGGARFSAPKNGFPFTVNNGILRIEARRNKQGEWQSGLIASVDPKGHGFAQQYGYFEMRARLPTGPGVWPAFWLIGSDRSKSTAEIDVLEYYGDKPGAYSTTVHVWHRDGGHYSRFKRIEVFHDADPAQFHTYGVKIDPAFIRIYFDRQIVWKTETPPEHKQPMYMLLDLGLVDGPTKEAAHNPSDMYVDYVRAYQLR